MRMNAKGMMLNISALLTIAFEKSAISRRVFRMLPAQLKIFPGTILHRFQIFLRYLGDASCGASQDQGAGGESPVVRHQAAGTNQAVISDHRIVHDNRTHADHAAVFNGAAMEDSSMSDGYICPNLCPTAVVTVNDTVILDIGIPADMDRTAITS